VVMLMYPLLVPVDLTEKQALSIGRPQTKQSMAIREIRPKVECCQQVPFDGNIAVQICFADSLLVHGRKSCEAAPFFNRDPKLDLPGADAMLLALKFKVEGGVLRQRQRERLQDPFEW